MIQDAAKSKVPALGYGMPYAIGNTLLTIFGMVDRAADAQGRLAAAEQDGQDRPAILQTRGVDMDAVTLRQYETLSPFEIKDDLVKVAAKTARASQVAFLNAGRGNPNWIATEPREAFFLLGQFAITESQRVMHLPAGVGGMPQAPGIAAGSRAGSRRTPTCPAPRSSAASFRGPSQTFGFDAGRVRPRAGRFDHRRQLPGARPHARAQRADRARVPAVGDVRRAAAGGHVRPLRGRRRHGGDVLHLQVAEGEPAAQSRRHDRAGDTDLHAVSRDAASRGLRPQDRHIQASRSTAGSSRTTISRSCSTRRSRRSSSSTPATRTPSRSARVDCGDRQRCSRSGPT